MDPDSSQYFLLVILLILSGFFSMSETALISLSPIRLRNMVDEDVKNAKLIQHVVGNPDKLLSAILIGNNLVNIGASAIATSIATVIFGSKGVGIATGVLTLLVLVFGEITPKTLARQRCETVSIFVIKPIAACVFLFTPLIAILNVVTGAIFKVLGIDKSSSVPLVTESEFLTMVDVSHEEGVLETPEREMINNVVDFGNTDAKDIMVPRTDMVAIEVSLSYAEVVEVFKEEQFSRLPVYSENTDNIVGILSIKDMLLIDDTENFDIRNYMREPYFTYESKPCSALFSIMKLKRLGMAIVLDEYGGTSGIVTLEDLIEEIVGEINDEYDENPEEIKTISENEFLVDGSTKIDDVNEIIGTGLESNDFESIGGYVIGYIGRFPESGEVVECDGIKFIIEQTVKNRVEKLRIILNKEEKES